MNHKMFSKKSPKTNHCEGKKEEERKKREEEEKKKKELEEVRFSLFYFSLF